MSAKRIVKREIFFVHKILNKNRLVSKVFIGKARPKIVRKTQVNTSHNGQITTFRANTNLVQMHHRLLLLLLAIPFYAASQSSISDFQIIPQPQSIAYSKGSFELKEGTPIYVYSDEADWATAAEYLQISLEPATGFKFDVQLVSREFPAKDKPGIFFMPDQSITETEAYVLQVSKDQVLIRAHTGAGAFYAVQTIRQLLPAEIFNQKKSYSDIVWKIPCCTIEDAPRFPYRGLHLDVCRHFFPVAFIKKYIDLLATHKLNTFHWHLTEDQGWRIEIKKYPKLQTIAACRKETMIGHYSDTPRHYDGAELCGFYTQEEIKEVVDYAQKRFVTIIPEIEMPGHSSAALAAYPELGCTGGPYATETIWGVFEDVYCAENEKTFQFIDDVLNEVCALFPGTYIHVGGDECPKSRWEACPKCQKRMKDESLKDAHELQSYFIKRAEAMLAKHDKKLIGWDEILEGGLAPSATVMSWRGDEGGIAAARSGHDAIMTPGYAMYLDHYQSDPLTEPLAIGGYLPLERVYNYDPVPEALNDDEAKHILGAQGNVWTEYIPNTDQVEYMAYPRVCALSEVVWTAPEKKDWNSFSNRLLTHFKRLENLNVHYAKSFYDVKAAMVNGKVELSSSMPEFDICYTTDGKEPTAQSHAYKGPFPLKKSATIKAAVFQHGKLAGKVSVLSYMVHKASGKPYTLSKEPRKYRGIEPHGLTNGLVGSAKTWDKWVGLTDADIDPVIDFGKNESFKKVTTHFVNSKGSWIYPPRVIAVYSSKDGKNFTLLGEQKIDAESMSGSTVETITIHTPKGKGRYLKLVATTFGKIPKGAAGAGEGAWLFLDEIIVE